MCVLNKHSYKGGKENGKLLRTTSVVIADHYSALPVNKNVYGENRFVVLIVRPLLVCTGSVVSSLWVVKMGKATGSGINSKSSVMEPSVSVLVVNCRLCQVS